MDRGLDDSRNHRFQPGEAGWEEHNLSQLKYFRSLGLRAKLEAVEGMADVVRHFQKIHTQDKFKTASDKNEPHGSSAESEGIGKE